MLTMNKRRIIRGLATAMIVGGLYRGLGAKWLAGYPGPWNRSVRNQIAVKGYGFVAIGVVLLAGLGSTNRENGGPQE